MLERELKEIHELRRRGLNATQFWAFMVHSPRHQKAWSESVSRGKLDVLLWRFLLDPSRRAYLEQWEKAHPRSEFFGEVDWFEVLSLFPISLRLQIIQLLGKSQSKEAVPILIRLFEEEPDLIVSEAFKALRLIPSSYKISYLIRSLQNAHPSVRTRSAEALGELRAEAKKAIPALIEALKDHQESVRSRAAMALGQIGGNRRIIPALTKALTDKNWYVCSMVARALGQIGSDASSAVPALLENVKQRRPGVEESVMALGKIGHEASFAVPLLVKMVREEMYWDNFLNSPLTSAIDALGNIGQPANGAVPTLILLLRSQDLALRRSTALALYRITGRYYSY